MIQKDMKQIELVIIGGGSAGMSAALSAKQAGCDNLMILERGIELGGILEQCIHNGFGLHMFHEELSGPAFAQRLIDQIHDEHIPYQCKTTVLSINEARIVTYINEQEGLTQVQAGAIILACGCFERTRGAIQIPGKRCKGVYTAGCAQRYLNMENILVGKDVFILGSGDIGLIMARRMKLEGANVHGVAELMPYSNGLTRNIVQCLEDFDIPLYLSHTVVDIKGEDHVEEVVIAKVDEQLQPIKGSEQSFHVDTLLLSVGLVPEQSLAQDAGIKLDPKTKGAIVNEHFETSIPHIYACGNALHVHDLVDFVCMEAKLAGAYAIHDRKHNHSSDVIPCTGAGEVSYVLPQLQHVDVQEDVTFSFRVKRPVKPAIIECSHEGGIFKTIKKPVLLPAEMQRITCKKEDLVQHSYIQIKVREAI